jgi:hypothetical protein
MTISDNRDAAEESKLVKHVTEPASWELEVDEIISYPYLFTMSKILTEKRVGKYAIEKSVTPVGTVVEGFDWHTGKIHSVKITFNYPVVKLTEDDNTWMSDNMFEVDSNLGAVDQARGDVLIGGLGIGMLPTLIKDKVNSIDIVELSQDVIDLVFHQVATNKMNIIQDEICHYLTTTEKKYDLVCIDVWQNTFLPLWDIEGMKGLAQRCLKPGGTTWCWLEEMYKHSTTKEV